MRTFFLMFMGIVWAGQAGAQESLCSERKGSLSPKAWSVHRADRIAVLNSAHIPDRDPNPISLAFDAPSARLCGAGSQVGDCRPGGPLADLITNGTFHAGSDGILGPTMRRGRLDAVIPSSDKVYGRGGLAIFEDGSTAICRPGESGTNLDVKTLNEICGRGSARLYEFIGGGALLVHRGQKVCSEGHREVGCDSTADLFRVQHFDQGGRGIESSQMRSTFHLLVAEKHGHLFVLWNTTPKTGEALQDELCDAGFESALKLDGGGGFFARLRNRPRFGAGQNPTGLLVSLQ